MSQSLPPSTADTLAARRYGDALRRIKELEHSRDALMVQAQIAGYDGDIDDGAAVGSYVRELARRVALLEQCLYPFAEVYARVRHHHRRDQQYFDVPIPVKHFREAAEAMELS